MPQTVIVTRVTKIKCPLYKETKITYLFIAKNYILTEHQEYFHDKSLVHYMLILDIFKFA